MPGAWMGAKYDVLGRQASAAQESARAQTMDAVARQTSADADASRSFSQSAVDRANAYQLIPAQTGETIARGGLYGAEEARSRGMLPYDQYKSYSESGVLNSQKKALDQNLGDALGEGSDHSQDYLNPSGGPIVPGGNAPEPVVPQYAKGTSKVPAKGKAQSAKGGRAPGKGMVEAGLAPGEAVLSPGAAEHFGRDNIGRLNLMSHHGMLPSQGPHLGGQPHSAPPQSIGALQEALATMGAGGGAGGPPGAGAAPAGQQPGFAKGTSNVQSSDSIGAPVRLQQSSLGGKPTPDLKLAKGTSKVPGKPTNPSKDTQHGQIPVGGAVLTNDAANHVGRGLIAHLNQLHAGMPTSGQPQQPGFAEGTADVPETNGQHLMSQIGSAWNYMTTPNSNSVLSRATQANGGNVPFGPTDMATGYQGLQKGMLFGR